MINGTAKNHGINGMVNNFAQWHHDRNLVDGATDNAQFEKLLEEVIELYMCINPGRLPSDATNEIMEMVARLHHKGRIKTEGDKSNLPDAVGDINVVLVNYSERHEFTMLDAFNRSWGDIKDRKGKMINGMFVKESDL